MYRCAGRIVQEAVADYQLEIIAELLSGRISTAIELATHCAQVHGFLDNLRIVRNRELDPINRLGERADSSGMLLPS